MTDRVQIGPRVSQSLWDEFRNDVQKRKGQTRGVLGDELENAIREYLRDEDRPIDRRIEKRLSRIEQAVGAAPTDGGTDTFEHAEDTHTPSRLDGPEKPSANAPTDKKVAYLAECVLDEIAPNSRSISEVPRKHLREVVKDEYGFRRDTAKRYVEQLIEYFDLVDHPDIDPMLVTPAKREKLIEQRRKELEADAEAELSGGSDR